MINLNLPMRILPSLIGESENQHLPVSSVHVCRSFFYVALLNFVTLSLHVCRSFDMSLFQAGRIIFCFSIETVPELALFRYVAPSILAQHMYVV